MTTSPNKPLLRVAVLLSGEGTSLENLCECIDRGELDCEIALVIASKTNVGGITRAERRNIPSLVLARKDYADTTLYNDALHQALGEHEIGLVALLGFLSLFEPRQVLAGRTINVHPALIPAFSGLLRS